MSLRSQVDICVLLVFLIACGLQACGVVSAPQSPPRPMVGTAPPERGSTAPSARPQLAAVGPVLPFYFEENRGQVDAQVQYLARGRGYTVFLTPSETVLALRPPGERKGEEPSVQPLEPASELAYLRLQFAGASSQPQLTPEEPLPGRVNYFLGDKPSEWHTGIPTYGRVRYHQMYQGIDVAYYGRQRQLEYDFIVQPGADPGQIRMQFQGAEDLALVASGDVILYVPGGEVRLLKPQVYQEINGKRQPVQAGYRQAADDEVGIVLGAYDTTRPLIIDPALVYSTYLGGNDFDYGFGIAVDKGTGEAYVTGRTDSPDFPRTGGAEFGGGDDVFVAKFNPLGTALVYATYVGGSNDDIGRGIAVDGSGNAYVTGFTNSTNFPHSVGGEFGGGPWDAFVVKLNTDGTPAYATFLGGNKDDEGNAIAVDGSGQAYVTGFTTLDTTSTTTFPVTAAEQPVPGGGPRDAFVVKLNTDGTPAYATFLGGKGSDQGQGITVDNSGQAYVTGRTESRNFPRTGGAKFGGGPRDAFVVKYNTDGTRAYATYLGGNGSDQGNGITVDNSGQAGQAYVTGFTNSTNLLTTPGALQPAFGGGPFDAFVVKLNAEGTALEYATYLGGSDDEHANGIVLDGSRHIYVAGSTASTNFPVTPGALQAVAGGVDDAFVVKLNAEGTALEYATYLGSSVRNVARGLAVDGRGNAYAGGYIGNDNTVPRDFPVTARAMQPTYGGGFFDAIVVKIRPVPTLQVTTPEDPNTLVTSLNFDQGTLSQLFTLRNTGSDQMVGQISLAEQIGQASPFILSHAGPFDLPPEGTLTVAVTFTPPFAGAFGDKVDIESSGGNAEVILSGEVEGSLPDIVGTLVPSSDLTVSPAVLNFGGVRVGQSRVLSFTVHNTGSSALSRIICLPASFSLFPLNTSTTVNLDVGKSQTYTLRFTPPQLSPPLYNGAVSFSKAAECPDFQDSEGEVSIDPATLRVSGSGMAPEARGLAYVVNRDENTVSVVDTEAQGGPKEVQLIPVGSQPVDLALLPDGSKAYVVNKGPGGNVPGTVSVIDTTTLIVRTTLTVGMSPESIVVTPNGRRVYVANRAGNSLAIINPVDDTVVIKEFAVARTSPAKLEVSPDSQVLYVLGKDDDEVDVVDVVDVETNEIAEVVTGQDPVAIAFSPDGQLAYVANKGESFFSILDTTTFPPTNLGPVNSKTGDRPQSVAVGKAGQVYVAYVNGEVSVFEVPSTSAVLAIEGGRELRAAAFNPADFAEAPLGNKNNPALIQSPQGNVGVVEQGPQGTFTPTNGSTPLNQLPTTALGNNPLPGVENPGKPPQQQIIIPNSGSGTVSLVTPGVVNAPQVSVGAGPVAVAVQVSIPPPPNIPKVDYDGDSATDIAIWRPSTADWWILTSRSSFTNYFTPVWGLAGDVPVPGDYDGDGTTDVAIWRPSTADWWILPANGSPFFNIPWGLPGLGDVPVPGDYDGDGTTDVAIWRPSTADWWILPANGTAPINRIWGLVGLGDVPVPGDYDGDGATDIAIWRPGTADWWILPANGTAPINRIWGLVGLGDVPVPGDYDGDGATDIAIWRPGTADWWILPANGTAPINRIWGLAGLGDVPVPGDYDGDGTTDVAIWRPSTADWWILPANGSPFFNIPWGLPGLGDVPVVDQLTILRQLGVVP